MYSLLISCPTYTHFLDPSSPLLLSCPVRRNSNLCSLYWYTSVNAGSSIPFTNLPLPTPPLFGIVRYTPWLCVCVCATLFCWPDIGEIVLLLRLRVYTCWLIHPGDSQLVSIFFLCDSVSSIHDDTRVLSLCHDIYVYHLRVCTHKNPHHSLKPLRLDKCLDSNVVFMPPNSVLKTGGRDHLASRILQESCTGTAMSPLCGASHTITFSLLRLRMYICGLIHPGQYQPVTGHFFLLAPADKSWMWR